MRDIQTSESIELIIKRFKRLGEFAKADTESSLELVLTDKFGDGGIVLRKPANEFDIWLLEWKEHELSEGRIPSLISVLVAMVEEHGLLTVAEFKKLKNDAQRARNVWLSTGELLNA